MVSKNLTFEFAAKPSVNSKTHPEFAAGHGLIAA
jgi:hypothetical protein